MQANLQMIVGLGNPGPQYENTRHNAGAWFIQALADKYNATLKLETKFTGFYGTATIAGQNCKLLIPTTFMNLSGQAVQALAHFYKILPETILVAHDELDFAPGVACLKFDGGHNGHNGLKNIIERLGGTNFYRLRIGIGKPQIKDDTINYVLNAPMKNEKEQITAAIETAIEVMPELISGSIAKAIQTLHSSNKNI